VVLYYFGYLLVGKLLIWLIQIFPPLHWFIERRKGLFRKYLEELFGCDLCLGTWVYFFLALVMQETILTLDYNIFTVIFSYFLTGVISAFVMHLITIGWRDKFSVMEIK
jgi:hypothetical protein